MASTSINPTPPKPSGLDLWIQRLKLGIDVVFFIELGMILLVLPWTPFYTNSTALSSYPAVKGIIDHGFFRGAISGLGLLNIWIGISDAVTYRE
ncbi:MAG TPA: hypothetical protein VM056_03195 [Terriglobales bacterium]|nr:hypothetical protein [Terriglobales bacterium]